jgi:E3 ubiquitin-protein ligase RFWD2
MLEPARSDADPLALFGRAVASVGHTARHHLETVVGGRRRRRRAPRASHLPSRRAHAPPARPQPCPWLVDASAPPPLSGCDSSACSYCLRVARERRLGSAAAPAVCWLRRRRSEAELAAAASGAGGAAPRHPLASAAGLPREPDACGGGGSGGGRPADASVWDEALLEPDAAAGALAAAAGWARRGGGRWRPWRDEPWMAARAGPAPAALAEVAAFAAPPPRGAACGAARCAPAAALGADAVCGMEFEAHGWLLATAGVARRLCVYSLAAALDGAPAAGAAEARDALDAPAVLTHAAAAGAAARPALAPLRAHRTAAKLSSLAWNPDQPGVVSVADYDGVVTQVDVESGHVVAEADGHGGARAWSVSHSPLRPHFAASAGADGGAALWAGPGLAVRAARLAPRGGAPLCGAHLSPFDANLLALASADHSAYVYDLRRAAAPLHSLAGHGRAVSYVRFLSRQQLVTASADATLAAWDLEAAAGDAGAPAPARVWRGHPGGRHFAGLAVAPEHGLVACGSEGREAFAYSLNWEAPLVRAPLGGGPGAPPAFCSAVAWQPAAARPGGEPLLAAAASDGTIRALTLQLRADAGPDEADAGARPGKKARAG